MSATGPEPGVLAGLSAAKIRDGKTDGAALLRIARELREAIVADCSACRERVPRHAIEGCDPPKYVHWHAGSKGAESTCSPCTSEIEQSVLADVDVVAEIGYWLYATTPLTFPISNAMPIVVGALSAPALFPISTTASGG